MSKGMFRKLTAALLCSAMMITPMGSYVAAAETGDIMTGTAVDNAEVVEEVSEEPEANVDAQEVELPIEEETVDAAEEDIEIESEDGAEIELDTEVSLPLEGEEPEEEDVEVEEDEEKLGVDTPSDCFLDQVGDLTLAPGYTSLAEYIRENDGKIVIPAKCTNIPKSENLFYKNRIVESIDFEIGGNGELTIEDGAFSRSSVESFTAPRNLDEIPNDAFKDCDKLKTLYLLNVTKVNESAFENCSELTSLPAGAKLTHIGKYAFRRTGIKFLDLGQWTVEADNILEEDNEDEIGGQFADCADLTTVIVPSYIKRIPGNCFEKCINLGTESGILNIKGRETVIGKYAFYECKGLTSINDEKNHDKFYAKEIEDNAFSGCTALKTAVFPETLSKIGANAFEGCTSLTLIEIHYQTEGSYIVEPDDDEFFINDTAFPDPIPSKATMRGYDGEVYEYATDNKHKFKKYESLHEAVLIESILPSGIGMTTSSVVNGKAAARPGQKVTITIKTGNNVTSKRVQRDTIFSLYVASDEFKFISGNETEQKYEFTMPYVPVDPKNGKRHLQIGIKPSFSTYTDKDDVLGIPKKDYHHDIFNNENRFYSKSADKYTVDMPGYRGQIWINALKNGNDTAIGQWMFTYSSSDQKVAVVSSTGEITTVGKGSTIITATYKGPTKFSVSFEVYVSIPTTITDIEIIPTEPNIEITYENRTIDDVLYEDVPVITYKQTELETYGDRIFDVKLATYEGEDDEPLYVKAAWSSGNSAFAGLAVTSGFDNENTVTVKKGARGETYIKAAYTKTESPLEILYAYLIIRVKDITPRTTNTVLTVDVNKDDLATGGGTELILYPYKENTINIVANKPVSFHIGPSNDPKATVPFDGLKAVWNEAEDEEGAARLMIAYNKKGTYVAPAVGKAIEYSGSKTIYISGEYNEVDSQGNPIAFKIPLAKVTMTNNPLKLAATMSGTINLFYNADCYDPLGNKAGYNDVVAPEKELPRKDGEKDDAYETRYINSTIGQIKAKNNIAPTTAAVRTTGTHKFELWSREKYAEYIQWLNLPETMEKPEFTYTDMGGKFAKNFDVMRDPDSDKDFIIRRSNNALQTELNASNKEVPVTSGYFAVWFNGYSLPVIQAVNISNKTAAPAYVLSSATTNEHVTNTGGQFRVSVINKSTKKVVIDNLSCAEGYPLLTTTSVDDFEDVVMDDTAAEDNPIILTAVDDYRFGKVKAGIIIKRKNWDNTMTLDYTVNFIEKRAGAKLSLTTVTLNKIYPAQTAETILSLDQPNAVLSIPGGFVAKPLNDDSECITISESDEDADGNPLLDSQIRLIANLRVYTDDNGKEHPKPGTYKFEYVPHYECVGFEEDLPKMTLSVKVVANEPSVKLGTGTYTYNITWGAEEAEAPSTIVTFGNLPLGVNYEDVAALVSDLDGDLDGVTFLTTMKKPKGTEKNYLDLRAKYDKLNEIGTYLRFDDSYGDDPSKNNGLKYLRYDEKTKKYSARLLFDSANITASFNNSYYVNGIKVNGVPVKDNTIKITVKGILDKPSVNVKNAGTINTVDYTTGIRCTPTFKYLSSPVIDTVEVWDVINNYQKHVSSVLTAEISDKEEDEGKNIVILKAIHNDDPTEAFNDVPGTRAPGLGEIKDMNHKVRIRYTLSNGKTLESQDFVVRPKQMLPALKTDPIKFTIYQGVDNTDGKLHRTKVFKLDKTSQLKTHISGVKIADSNPANIKQAFDIEYYESALETAWYDAEYKDLTATTLYAGDVTITCKYPELLVPGKTYEVALEAIFDGQFYKRDANGKVVAVEKWVFDENRNPVKVKNKVLTPGSIVKIKVEIKK